MKILFRPSSGIEIEVEAALDEFENAEEFVKVIGLLQASLLNEPSKESLVNKRLEATIREQKLTIKELREAWLKAKGLAASRTDSRIWLDSIPCRVDECEDPAPRMGRCTVL